MGEQILHLFSLNPKIAIFVSLVLQVVVAVAGVLPTFFITAANIHFFDFWPGVFVSFIGEALGAMIAFIIYRKGFGNVASGFADKHPSVQQLISLDGIRAAKVIFILRLMPFVPSGLVTAAAAVGSISPWLFFIASSIGKVPALLLEALAVQQVLELSLTGKLIIFLVGLLFVYQLLMQKK